jgi:hypothetical protein
LQPSTIQTNQILIKSNVRPVEDSTRKSQVISTIPLISSNNNRNSSFAPLTQSPDLTYQPQTSTKVENYQNYNINTTNSRPVFTQQSRPINFQAQTISTQAQPIIRR